jgi:hypothetical protein
MESGTKVMAIVTDVDSITVDWLRDRLREKHGPAAGQLRSFRAEPVAKQGMTSVAHILTLDYRCDPGTCPHKLLTKFSLEIAPVKEAMAANRGFEREVVFYSRFAEDPGIPTPRCYWAQFDPKAGRCGLLLDYIDDSITTDVFSGQVDDIEKVAATMAPFHARWWNRPELRAVALPGMAPFMLDPILTRLRPALANLRGKYRDQVGKTLIAVVEFWLDNALRLAEREQRQPQTLCHGDLHREQILFPRSTAGSVHVIDWQLSGSDSAATDIAYLLVSGLRPNERKAHERRIVESYHADLNSHGVTGYPLDQFWQSYRLGIARQAMFYMTAFAMDDMTPVLDWWNSDPKRRDFSFWDVTCRWVGEALEEHDVLARLAAMNA